MQRPYRQNGQSDDESPKYKDIQKRRSDGTLLTLTGNATLIQFSHGETVYKGNSLKPQTKYLNRVWRKSIGSHRDPGIF